MALTIKEQDNPLIYNALKICGTLTDDNFKQIDKALKQAEARGKLDIEDIRIISELCPILIDGVPPRIFMWKQFKMCLDAKAPLIDSLAYRMPKSYQETLRDATEDLKEAFNNQMDEWAKRIFK